jgi:hypothetical protein
MSGQVGGTTPQVEQLVWDGLLNAKFNIRYYEALYRRYRPRDQALRAVLGVTSPATLASLGAWDALPEVKAELLLVTGAIGVVAAISAVLNAVLGYSELLGEFKARYGTWFQIQEQFDRLERLVDSGQVVTLDQFEAAHAEVPRVSAQELAVPRDVGLMAKCQDEVKTDMYA